ncbi:MAG: hypothetical protein ACRDRX_24915 [Pseudonocardiaceae bacterium]
MTATVIVAVNRGGVWISIDPPFAFEAILEPAHVDILVNMLTEATKEAQRYEQEKVT